MMVILLVYHAGLDDFNPDQYIDRYFAKEIIDWGIGELMSRTR